MAVPIVTKAGPEAEFPEKLECLFEDHRYKILYGGRGSGRSWGCARALLLQGTLERHRILCAREIQKSIADSVHQLLKTQIELLGLRGFYEVQEKAIYGKNGTEFIFAGLRHNIENIKSIEGITRAWVEEGQTVIKSSWDKLIPTIRAPGSQIWCTFNPELETDETYKRFVLQPPSGAAVVKMNYYDNPWFPDVLRKDMEDLKKRNFDEYLHIWEGHCRQFLDGAIYAQELREARQAGRICKVPYDPTKPVHVFFDLGWSDQTAIWFVQRIGFEYRILKGYSNRQMKLLHYLQYMQKQGYIYDTVHLPHDAKAHQLGTGKSIEEMVRAAGYKVSIVPRLEVEDGINALRTIFPNMYWDEENCADGLQAMSHYRYKLSEKTGQFAKVPLHDENSNYADAARYIAVGFTEKKPISTALKTVQVSRYRGVTRGTGWMGS